MLKIKQKPDQFSPTRTWSKPGPDIRIPLLNDGTQMKHITPKIDNPFDPTASFDPDIFGQHYNRMTNDVGKMIQSNVKQETKDLTHLCIKTGLFETSVVNTVIDTGKTTCELCDHESKSIEQYLKVHGISEPHLQKLQNYRDRVHSTMFMSKSREEEAKQNQVKLSCILSRHGIPTNRFISIAFDLTNLWNIPFGNNQQSRKYRQNMEHATARTIRQCFGQDSKERDVYSVAWDQGKSGNKDILCGTLSVTRYETGRQLKIPLPAVEYTSKSKSDTVNHIYKILREMEIPLNRISHMMMDGANFVHFSGKFHFHDPSGMMKPSEKVVPTPAFIELGGYQIPVHYDISHQVELAFKDSCDVVPVVQEILDCLCTKNGIMNSAKAKVKFNELTHDGSGPSKRIGKLSATRFLAHLSKILLTDNEKFESIAKTLVAQSESVDKTTSSRAKEAFDAHVTTQQILVRSFLQPITEVFSTISKAAQDSQTNLQTLYWWSVKVLEDVQNLTDEEWQTTFQDPIQDTINNILLGEIGDIKLTSTDNNPKEDFKIVKTMMKDFTETFAKFLHQRIEVDSIAMKEQKNILDAINPNFLNPPTLKTLSEIKLDFPKIYQECFSFLAGICGEAEAERFFSLLKHIMPNQYGRASVDLLNDRILNYTNLPTIYDVVESDMHLQIIENTEKILGSQCGRSTVSMRPFMNDPDRESVTFSNFYVNEKEKSKHTYKLAQSNAKQFISSKRRKVKRKREQLVVPTANDLLNLKVIMQKRRQEKLEFADARTTSGQQHFENERPISIQNRTIIDEQVSNPNESSDDDDNLDHIANLMNRELTRKRAIIPTNSKRRGFVSSDSEEDYEITVSAGVSESDDEPIDHHTNSIEEADDDVDDDTDDDDHDEEYLTDDHDVDDEKKDDDELDESEDFRARSVSAHILPSPKTSNISHSKSKTSMKLKSFRNSELESVIDSISETNFLSEKVADSFGRLMNMDLQYDRLSTTSRLHAELGSTAQEKSTTIVIQSVYWSKILYHYTESSRDRHMPLSEISKIKKKHLKAAWLKLNSFGWLSDDKLLEKNLILMPLCVNKHWMLLSINGIKTLNDAITLNPKTDNYPTATFEVFDPMNSSQHSLQETAAYAALFRNYVMIEFEENQFLDKSDLKKMKKALKVIRPRRVPQQPNGYMVVRII